MIQRDVINVKATSSEVPVILARFKRNFDFLDTFSKKAKMSNLFKIRLVGVELFHAGGKNGRQKDLTTLIVAFFFFRNFANALKIEHQSI
jgi:hypothetical protein